MDTSPEWLSELEMENASLLNPYPANQFSDDFDLHSLSPETPPIDVMNKSNKQDTDTVETPKQDVSFSPFSYSAYFTQPDSPSAHLDHLNQILCCTGNLTNHVDEEVAGDADVEIYLSLRDLDDNAHGGLESCKTVRGSPSKCKSSLDANYRIVAERKRRERLNQKFISLSAVIPGLKKMDKASILGDAIRYIKQLEERVQSLEGQVKQKSTDERRAARPPEKRSRSSVDNESCLSNESPAGKPNPNPNPNPNQQIPRTEVRVSNSHVLVRIYCKKQNGVVERMFSELDKNHLDMISGTIVPTGDSAFDIIIMAKMGDEVRLVAKDLVRSLRSAILEPM